MAHLVDCKTHFICPWNIVHLKEFKEVSILSDINPSKILTYFVFNLKLSIIIYWVGTSSSIKKMISECNDDDMIYCILIGVVSNSSVFLLPNLLRDSAFVLLHSTHFIYIELLISFLLLRTIIYNLQLFTLLRQTTNIIIKYSGIKYCSHDLNDHLFSFVEFVFFYVL